MILNTLKRWVWVSIVTVLSACHGELPTGAASGQPTAIYGAITVVPDLGQVVGAVAEAIGPDGTVWASEKVNSSGKATLVSTRSTFPDPLVIRLKMVAGSTYYDEVSDSTLTVAPGSEVNLYSMMTGFGSSARVGVNPFSHLAAKLAGIHDNHATAAGLTPAKIAKAVATVNIVSQLPADFNMLFPPERVAIHGAIPTRGLGAVISHLALSIRPGPGATPASPPDTALSQAVDIGNAVNDNGEIVNLNTLLAIGNLLSAYNTGLGDLLQGLYRATFIGTISELQTQAATEAVALETKIKDDFLQTRADYVTLTPSGGTGAAGGN